jgi:hypothetical protein
MRTYRLDGIRQLNVETTRARVEYRDPSHREALGVRSGGLRTKRAWTRRSATTEGVEDGLILACCIVISSLRRKTGQLLINSTSAQL